MVDTDSVQSVGDLRVALIMTVYSAPRTNSHNILLDKHVQKTAFDCANRKFIGIQTRGYLNNKQVGSSPETEDWKNKLIPLKSNPLTGILSTEPKATFGQVNSVAGANNDYTLLQISAPVQPGNSGGPVFDASGLVIGVVVSQASMALSSITGSVPQNINFAIRGEFAQIFLTAHGVKFETGWGQRKLETDEIAAVGQRSTVLVACVLE
jgi:hypothetical protein